MDKPSAFSGNEEHMKLVNDMGITVATLADGRVQLLHSFSNAKSVQDAEEGLLFMQEMVDISKSQAAETQPQTISFMNQGDLVNLNAGPAHFGRQLRGSDNVSARVGVANPLRACDTLTNPEWLRGRIAIVERGDCMFVEKARRLMLAGAVGGIVVDNSPESSAGVSPMFAMSGDGTDDVTIPLVFLFSKDAWKLLQALAYDPTTIITMSDHHSEKADSKSDIPEKKEPIQLSTLQQIKGSVQNFLFNDDSSDAQTSSSDDQRPIGKQQASEMGGGEGGGQGSSPSIRISRRDAYLSSEGTTVVPPFYREHLRKLLLEMLAKPHQAEKWLKQSRDQDDLVQVEVSSTSSSSPSTTPSSSSSSGSSHNLVGIKLPDEL